MKLFAQNLSFFLILVLFVGCEKFELDDHCPDSEGPTINPQELRVNDDSDREEEAIVSGKTISAQDEDLDLHQNESSFGSEDGGGTSDTDDNDDLVNDDSDDEDEGVRPRIPGGTSGSGGSSPK